jgi:hypothetical protein
MGDGPCGGCAGECQPRHRMDGTPGSGQLSIHGVQRGRKTCGWATGRACSIKLRSSARESVRLCDEVTSSVLMLLMRLNIISFGCTPFTKKFCPHYRSFKISSQRFVCLDVNFLSD